ncbi:BofC C-terminal domain-containing protein [Bacillaceae bacterium S4-13-56]
MKKWTLLLIFIILSEMISLHIQAKDMSDQGSKEEDKASWEREPLTIEIELKTKYIDGQEEEVRKKQTIWSMEDLWSDYSDYRVTHQDQGEINFLREVDDISPETKENGRIGINEKGELTLYYGNPEKGKAVHSYFQINLDALESYQYEELEKGIPIPTKEVFLEVMETYTQEVSASPKEE